MDDGGVLVITGSARTGKTSLLEQLTPDSIIDNSRSGLEPGASVPSEQVPSGLFSIDETQAHDRRDIVRMIAEMMTAKRGFALVFQRPETFRDYQIGEYLAAHPVQFLNLSDR
jgi:ABC-type polar amino acid transport system ATPase subunit